MEEEGEREKRIEKGKGLSDPLSLVYLILSYLIENPKPSEERKEQM